VKEQQAFDQALGEVHEIVAAAHVREIVNEEGLHLFGREAGENPSGIRRKKSTTRGVWIQQDSRSSTGRDKRGRDGTRRSRAGQSSGGTQTSTRRSRLAATQLTKPRT
jgi:hypothetical protein